MSAPRWSTGWNDEEEDVQSQLSSTTTMDVNAPVRRKSIAILHTKLHEQLTIAAPQSHRARATRLGLEPICTHMTGMVSIVSAPTAMPSASNA